MGFGFSSTPRPTSSSSPCASFLLLPEKMLEMLELRRFVDEVEDARRSLNRLKTERESL